MAVRASRNSLGDDVGMALAHWFTTLFSMAAAWAAFASLEERERRLRWPLIAGAAAGAATMCTPNSGGLAMLAAATAFLNPQNRSALIAYVFGCALAPAGALAYLIGQHTLAAAFDDVIRFTATRYAFVNTVPFGFHGGTYNRPLILVFALASLLTLLVWAYDRRGCLRDRRMRLCVAVYFAGFVGCYPRPSFVVICVTVPLALPLLAFCATRLTQFWRPTYRYAAAAVMMVLFAPSALIFEGLAREALRAEIVPTPRGDVALIRQVAAQWNLPELLASIAATRSGDAYFFYPYDEMLPFLSAREHVSKYDLFQPWYTTPAQYEDACRSVMRRASWVVVETQSTDGLREWKRSFPSMPDAWPRETIRFRQALDGAFELVSTKGAFELRHRREGVSDAVCDSISQ